MIARSLALRAWGAVGLYCWCWVHCWCWAAHVPGSCSAGWHMSLSPRDPRGWGSQGLGGPGHQYMRGTCWAGQLGWSAVSWAHAQHTPAHAEHTRDTGHTCPCSVDTRDVRGTCPAQPLCSAGMPRTSPVACGHQGHMGHVPCAQGNRASVGVGVGVGVGVCGGGGGGGGGPQLFPSLFVCPYGDHCAPQVLCSVWSM